MRSDRRLVADSITLSVTALLLYHLGPLLLFFLVPMQMLIARRGDHAYANGILVFLGGEVVFKAFSLILHPAVSVKPLMVSFDILLPLALLAGLYMLNRRHYGRIRYGEAVGIYVAAIAAGVVSLPLIIYMDVSNTLASALRDELSMAQQVGLIAKDSSATIDSLVKITTDLFYRLYLFGVVFVLIFGWYLGNRLSGVATGFRGGRQELPAAGSRGENEAGDADSADKSKRGVPAAQSVRPHIAGEADQRSAFSAGGTRFAGLRGFFVPAAAAWVLIVTWGGVLAGRFVSLGPFTYPIWNFAFVSGLVYALQGLAILATILDRYRVGRGVRVLLAIAGIVLLFVPVANVVVSIAVPILGVSEIWIQYRKREAIAAKEK